MATYQTKLCPHCDYIYELHQLKGKTYGSPFITCPRCSKIFVDKEVIEMALETDAPINTPKFSFIDITMPIMGGSLIYGAFDSSSDMFYIFFLGGILFLIGGLYLLISDIKSFNKRRQATYQEFLESSQRLSNPQYLQALKSIGIHLPKKYEDYLSKSKETQTNEFPHDIIKDEVHKVKVKPVKKQQ